MDNIIVKKCDWLVVIIVYLFINVYKIKNYYKYFVN